MRPFLGPLAAAFLGLSLASCSSVPPSSMAELALLNPLTMKPADIRVVITFPDGIRLKQGDVVMDIVWKNAETGASITRHFALELVTGNAAAPQIGRMLREDERLYLMMLNSADAESFQAMQAEVLAARNAGARGTGSLSVGFAGGCTADPALGKGPVRTSVLLRPDAVSGYLPIFADMDLMSVLRSAGLEEVPQCGNDLAGPAGKARPDASL